MNCGIAYPTIIAVLHWKVIKHVRAMYSCSACQKIVQASAPSRPTERSYAGPGLLAHMLVSKFCQCRDRHWAYHAALRTMPQRMQIGARCGRRSNGSH